MPATPSYIVVLKNGSQIEIPGATDVESDGAGTYFFDASGKKVSVFRDGEVSAAYPSTATVTPPPSPEEPPAE